MDRQETRQRYQEAVDALVDRLREDANVIAVILCGSLAYDAVWEKSDVDMTLVVADQNLNNHSYCLVEDGIGINVAVIGRSRFRRSMERMASGSWMHSYYSKGRILYTRDESLVEFFEEIKYLGTGDLAHAIFFRAGDLIGLLNKSEKWLVVREDLLYCQYYLLRAAGPLADMVVYLQGEVPSRESIQRAREINPQLIKAFYDDLMCGHCTHEHLAKAISRLEAFLQDHLGVISQPLLEYLADGQIRTISQIVEEFKSDSHFIVGICEYLSEHGVIEKVSKTIRVTPKSRMAVEEMAYLYAGELGGVR